MKTTNYEISKQLVEAKFKANQVWNQEGHFWGYDLETILEALPRKIARGEGRAPISFFIFTKDGMGYAQKPQIEFQEFYNKQENESLADTAARLWLKLKKEGLV